jgi:hypothetical protein
MREKWNRQMPLMPEIANHVQAKKLEAISGIIDSKSIICQLVLQNLCKGRSASGRRAGAKGMSAEQVLRSASVSRLYRFTGIVDYFMKIHFSQPKMLKKILPSKRKIKLRFPA